MKYISIALFFALCTTNVIAQKDNKEIKVGTQLPALSLGKIMDNTGNLSSQYKGKKNFSDFKGKLVILDFWTTYCSSCIAGFEKMSRLQSKLDNQIQIFLVNKSEDAVKIKEWLAIQNKKKAPGKIIPDNLPVIADAKELGELFPVHGEIGYHVWIGPDGIVRLRGISENTHEGKIKQLLAGKPISFILDNSLAYKPDRPFFFTKSETSPAFSSSFGPFDDRNASSYSAGAESYRDSISKTKRNSYINFDILGLYQTALRYVLLADTSLLKGIPIEIEVDNKAIVTQNEEILNRKATDEDFRNKVSYEQIVPEELSDTVAKKYMMTDLNRYLFLQFGISGNWEKRSIKCSKLVSVRDLNQLRSKQTAMKLNYAYKNGRMYSEYKGYPLKSLFKDYLRGVKNVKFDNIIIDGMGSNIPVDLTLPNPGSIKDYQTFLNTLENVGLSLTSDSVTRDVFIIRKEG